MTGISEEEKYKRKAALLQRALQAADKMDKADAGREEPGLPASVVGERGAK